MSEAHSGLMIALPLISGISAIALAALVVSTSEGRSNSRLTRWSFGYFSLAMGAWAVLISFYLAFPDHEMAVWAVRGYYIAAAALVHGFILFCLQLEVRLQKIVDPKLLGAVFLFIALLSFAPDFLFVLDEYNQVQLNMGPYALYSLYFIATYIIAMVVLRTAYRLASNQIKRRQRMALIVATSIAFPAGALFNLVLPGLGNYNLIAIGPLFILPIVVIVGYSILRYGLFDLRLAAVRTVGYAASLVSLVAVYLAAAYGISLLILGRDSYEAAIATPVSLLLALLLAVIYQPVKNFFDAATDRMFYQNHYKLDQMVGELGSALASTTVLRTMLERAAEVLYKGLRASHVSFVVKRENRKDLVITVGKNIVLSDADIDKVWQGVVATYDGVLEVQKMAATDTESDEMTAAARLLARKRYDLLLPVGDGVCIVLIGERLGGSYSRRDKRMLLAISTQLQIAIQNARSVEEVRRLNATLQQRIEAATRKLVDSNDRLRKLDEAKNEFVSMASHQLRTPLTSVKGYISMLLDGDAGKISDQQRHLLSEAFTSSERMVRLISDFLNVSRLQTGKFMIDAKPVNIVRVVSEEMESMGLIAEAHGQTLHYHGPDDLPEVIIDEDKTRQVIMNFIDNAIYYSPGGSSITVKLHSARGRVVFEVHDRGMGVPKAEQAKLFTKFFRAENARRQRPDGTGVGLFLAKKVIEAQGGEIIFHSRPGMGSVFGFKLPAKK